MKTVNCKRCGSVMGLAKETPQWAVYRCFSCRNVMGRLNKDLQPEEREEAEREMDEYAFSLTDHEAIMNLQNMSSQEFQDLFKVNQPKPVSPIKRFFRWLARLHLL